MGRRNESGDDTATVTRAKAEKPHTSAAKFALVAIAGPDKGASFAIEVSQPSRVLVGQGPACAFKLGDRQVSRRHAALELDGARLRLTDLGSTNGTLVNGLAVLDAYLCGGEIVSLGETKLRVDLVEAATTVALPTAQSFGATLGASPEMRKLYPLCAKLAASSVPLIIEGETGTGKEVLAESIHQTGPRAKAPFVVFDCTTVPANLAESALFGHERGAFTGATEAKPGVFEEADSGTLLIDEIGDLDLALQPKLLRAIERAEVRRVGGNRWVKVDVRVIAATRRNLDQAVAAGTFRDDLFFRLAIARIELPPLRKRHGDVEVLAAHFWRALADGAEPLPANLLARFEGYEWPGNVRELHNVIAARIALGELAGTEPRAARGAAQGDFMAQIVALDLPWPRARQAAIHEFTQRYVEHVLGKFRGNVARAAAASGIARRYFQLLRSGEPRVRRGDKNDGA